MMSEQQGKAFNIFSSFLETTTDTLWKSRCGRFEYLDPYQELPVSMETG